MSEEWPRAQDHRIESYVHVLSVRAQDAQRIQDLRAKGYEIDPQVRAERTLLARKTIRIRRGGSRT